MTRICSKCNIEKSIEGFVKRADRSGGYRKYCKDCNHKYLFEYRSKNKEKLSKQIKNHYFKYKLESRYKACIRSAKSKNREFTLTLEEFDFITRQACYYCGGFIKKDHNGIFLIA